MWWHNPLLSMCHVVRMYIFSCPCNSLPAGVVVPAKIPLLGVCHCSAFRKLVQIRKVNKPPFTYPRRRMRMSILMSNSRLLLLPAKIPLVRCHDNALRILFKFERWTNHVWANHGNIFFILFYFILFYLFIFYFIFLCPILECSSVPKSPSQVPMQCTQNLAQIWMVN
jgi:hypothetical protein